jgi:hypothetical protein
LRTQTLYRDDLPEEEKQSQGLKRSLNDLQYYADMWEEE